MIELTEIEMMMEAIGMAMDEHGIKCADGHWMTNDELTSVLSNRFDSTAFKKVMPEIYKAYTKQVSSRRFTISV